MGQNRCSGRAPAAGVQRTRGLPSPRPGVTPQHRVAAMNVLRSGLVFWPVLLVSLYVGKFSWESVFYNYANQLKYLAQTLGY